MAHFPVPDIRDIVTRDVPTDKKVLNVLKIVANNLGHQLRPIRFGQRTPVDIDTLRNLEIALGTTYKLVHGGRIISNERTFPSREHAEHHLNMIVPLPAFLMNRGMGYKLRRERSHYPSMTDDSGHILHFTNTDDAQKYLEGVEIKSARDLGRHRHRRA
jgi:hypothetical protein